MTGVHSACRRRILGIFALFATSIFLLTPNIHAEDFSWANLDGQNWQTSVKGGAIDPDVWGGQCWAFAINGILESKYMLTRNDNSASSQVNFSEQQLVWDSYTSGGQFGWGAYYAVNHGMVTEAECPVDTNNNNAYLFNPADPLRPWPIQSTDVYKPVGAIGGLGNSIQAVKDALKKYGPLYQGCSASIDFYGQGAGAEIGGHAVVLVGYHDNVGSENAPGGGYWIIKNDFGADFGYSGYNYIPYDLQPRNIYDTAAFTGAVYYTAAMTSATWSGGANTWIEGGYYWNAGTYAWENKETAATFNGTGGVVTISGSVIAHGLTIDATNYSFTGGSLTVTAGGITANQSTSISSPLYIGGPQTWTVASGKTLTVNGALHTVISDTTVAGAGNVTINGLIDGGGVANGPNDSYMKPGALIKSNTGSLTLNAASNYGGDITVNTGTLTFAAGGTYSGALYGSGGISCGNAAISLGGGASSFWGTIVLPSSATFTFIPTDGVRAAYCGAISGSGPVVQNGPGTSVLGVGWGDNTYTNTTTVLQGALEANDGFGLPTNSFLNLNGGVLQSNYYPFTRSLGTSGNAFQWGENGGGFAAFGNPVTVNIGGGATLNWGTGVGVGIMGPLKFGSTTATSTVTFQNGINLNGAERTINVDKNANSADDVAVITGAIIDSTGTGQGGIIKTGAGRLILTNAGNSYGDSYGNVGRTIIAAGALQAASGIVPAASCIQLDGGVFQSSGNFNRVFWNDGYTDIVTWNSGGFAANGGKLTVNMYSDGRAIAWTGDGHSGIVGAMVLNSNSADSELEFQNGLDLRGGARTIQVEDNPFSSGDFVTIPTAITDSVGGASLTKTGTGVLYITGATPNSYSGLTTLNGGTVILQKTGGAIAIPGDLTIGPGPYNAYTPSTHVRLAGSNQISSSSVVTFHGSFQNQWAFLELFGNNQTVGGLNCTNQSGFIAVSDQDTCLSNSTLTINNTVDCWFNGIIHDSGGASTGSVSLVKTGPGTQTFVGMGFEYTGGTTVNDGILQIGDGIRNSVVAGVTTVNPGGTVTFFNPSPAGFVPGGQRYYNTGTVVGSGTVIINLQNHASWIGSTFDSSLANFGGTTVIVDSALYAGRSNAFGTGSINVGSGSTLALWTGTTTTFTNPITLNDIGTAKDGWAKPAIYGDGGAGTFTLSGQITLAGTSDIGNYVGNGVLTLSGKITGPGGLVLGKAAPSAADESGAIAIAGATSNDYTGGTTINRGTVYLAKTGGAIAIPGNVTVTCSPVAPSGPTYLILNGNNEIAQTAVMNFSGTYAVQNPYFELLGYSQTLAGINDTTSAGVIEHAESETNITANSTLTVNTTAADSYFNGYFRDGNYGSGSTGKLALVKSGSYKLTLVGPNVSGYTGGTTVNGGTLQFGDGTTNAVLPGNASVSSGATIAFDVATSTVVTYPGVISGAGGVTVLGTGDFTLSGANTYTGATIAQNANGLYAHLYLNSASSPAVQGNVVLNGCYWLIPQAANQFGPNSSVQWLSAAEFNLNGKNQTVAGISGAEGHGVIEAYHSWYADPGANATLTINNSADCYYNGVIYDGPGGMSRTLAIVKSGTGKLTLANNAFGLTNGWTGGTIISAGTLQIGDGTTNPVLPGNVTNNATLTFNVANGTTNTCSGVISGTGVVNNIGAGTTTISAAPTYTGATNVSAGTLNFTGGLPGGAYSISGGALNINALSKSIGTFTLTGGTVTGAGTLTSTAAYNIQAGTVNPILAGSVALNKTGTGTAILNGVDTYTGTTTVSAGALQANNAAGLPNASYLVLNGGVLQSNGSTAVSFTRGLATSGAGKFRFGASGGGFSAGPAAMNVNIGGAGASVTWGTTQGTNIVGTLKLGSTTAANVTTLQNPIALGTSARTVQVDDNMATAADYAVLSGVLSGTGGLTKTGAGVLALTATNTYTGTTSINAGALQANNGAGLPSSRFLSLNGGVLQSNGASAVSFTRSLGTSGSTFQFTTSGGGFSAGAAAMNVNIGGAGASVTWGTSGNVIKGTLKFGSATAANVTTLANPVALGTSVRTVQVDDNPYSTADYAVMSGVISGSGGLTKTGTGRLVLSNTGSSYTGATTVNGGLLAAVGASIDGTIAVNSGGAFSPGLNVGSATTGAATWSNGGKYLWEIDSATGSAGSAWDLWSITGNLSASSTFTIAALTESSDGVLGQMPNFNNANSYQWLLASTTGTMPSNLVSLLSLDRSGFQNALAATGRLYFTESADYKSLYLNYAPTGGQGFAAMAPVPEPGTLALLAAGLVGLLAYGWRKRK